MTSQKDIFFTSEGDAWFRRNEAALASLDWSADAVCRRIASLSGGASQRVLEIGCGDGSRLEQLARSGHRVSGVDPSQAAIVKGRNRGVDATQGTADKLPFADDSFDVVIFGFCLYLCDDADLFRIGAEADRVLAASGWLLILDFESPAPNYRPYHHFPGVQSRKMDYKSMFLWHPAYTLASHEKFDHATHAWTDDPANWVSLACLRKHLRR
jgi:ubiquinone/menaquinone biosynthesis C-methylase UbiE